MAYTSVDHTLNHLVRLESTRGLNSSAISLIQALKLEFEFVRTFLRWTVKRCLDNGNLEGLLKAIEVVVRNAGRYLQPLSSDRVRDMGKHLDDLVPKVLRNIQLLKPEIEQVFVAVAKSPSSGPTAPLMEVEEFLNSVIENLNDLLIYLDISTRPAMELRSLEKKLRFLRNFLRFAAARGTKIEKLNDLSAHAESVVVEAAYLSFMCSFDPIKEDIKERLTELRQKIEPITPEVRGIYVGVIQSLEPSTTESQTADVELARFIDTLQEYLADMLNHQPSWMASLKVNIEVLHQELMFLSSFVKDPPLRSIENGRWKDPIDDAVNDLQGKLTSWGNFDAHPSSHYPELLKLKGQLIRIEVLAVHVGYAILNYFHLSKLEEARCALDDLLGTVGNLADPTVTIFTVKQNGVTKIR